MSDDRALLAAWRQGHDDAGQELFARHFDAVCRFFMTKVADGVDDLVQRTFLGCAERRESWPDDVAFRPYLLGIARNVLRRRFREKEYAGRRFDMLESSVAASGRTPSSIAHERRESAMLVVALQQLPVDHQIALELRFWEDMTVPEIAAVLEVPAGTAKTRLRRARALLDEALAKARAGAAPPTETDIATWARRARAYLSSQ